MTSEINAVYFKFRPDAVQAIRKMYNLDEPGRIEEAIDIIEEWIQKQGHFMNKNFDRGYLERFIIGNKGLLERVKERLDKKCTIVNLTKLIGPYDVKEFKTKGAVTEAMLPSQTEDFKRICMYRLNPGYKFTSAIWVECNKIGSLLFEYLLKHDYSLGFHVIMDVRDVNLIDLLSSVNLSESKEYANLIVGSSAIRMKSLHIITASKATQAMVGLLKQLYSSFKYEMHVHQDLEGLYKYIPRKLLPADYGGEEDTLENIAEKYYEVLSSEEHLEHMRWVCEARTDESRRPVDKFNEKYMGMTGTFRTLVVD